MGSRLHQIPLEECAMANLNKVMLIGRVMSAQDRPPTESRTFANGGKVTKFRIAVNFMNAKKNPTTGAWEGGESAFIDVEAFNREHGRQLADLTEKLTRLQQIFFEGRLRMNEWTDKDGQKRSKLLIVADNIEFLDKREDGGESAGGGGARPMRSAAAPARKPAPSYPSNDGGNFDEHESGPSDVGGGGGQEEDIPF